MNRWSSEQEHLDNGLQGRLLAMRFRKEPLFLQTSVRDFLTSSPVARVSPPVLLHPGDDDPHNLPTIDEEASPQIVTCVISNF